MIYFDKNGNEIRSGMVLRNSRGEEKKVYECSDEFGAANLGFLASNPRFLELHPDWPEEYYPLSQFNLAEYEIVRDEEAADGLYRTE
jgi:Ni,Fe-hydrogenase III component G